MPLILYYEPTNKKLNQKDFHNFKESIGDLIKLHKESRLGKESPEESEDERSERLRRFGQELKELEDVKFVKVREGLGRRRHALRL